MIEPSNAELSELPDCSRRYIADLEEEIERLRKVIGDIEAKAALGAQCMGEDERGQQIAKGFKVIADFARAALR